MQQFRSTPSMLSFPTRLPLLQVARNGFRTHGGQEENYSGVKSFNKMFFHDLGKHFRLLLQFHGSLLPLRLLFQLLVLWIKTSPKIFRPLSLAAQKCHEDSRILYGRPTDDGDDGPLATVLRLLLWIHLIAKHHPILTKRNPRSHRFATNLGDTTARQGMNQAPDNIFHESNHTHFWKPQHLGSGHMTQHNPTNGTQTTFRNSSPGKESRLLLWTKIVHP